MKTKLGVLVIVLSMFITGCNNSKTIDGTVYNTYGLVNEDLVRDPNILYELSPSSVIVAIVFSEMIAVPIYVIGWDLYQPVRKRDRQTK